MFMEKYLVHNNKLVLFYQVFTYEATISDINHPFFLFSSFNVKLNKVDRSTMFLDKPNV